MTSDMQQTDNRAPKHAGERRAWVYIMLMVNIVFILLLMTLGIIALRVGNYLPENTDILFIVGKNPEVSVGDGEIAKWETGQRVNIFQSAYANGQGEPTVVSQDGTKVVAPGTLSTYRFTMCNSGNMAVLYEIDLDFILKIGTEVQETYNFPMQVRLRDASGNYLIGSETEWVNVKDAILNRHVSLLGAFSYETFTMELLWEFEGGDDELDTLYGNLAAQKGVTLTLGINTFAEEHFDSTAPGGTEYEVEGTKEFGGTIRWLWLTLLFINTAVLVFYVSWLMNKRLRKW